MSELDNGEHWYCQDLVGNVWFVSGIFWLEPYVYYVSNNQGRAVLPHWWALLGK